MPISVVCGSVVVVAQSPSSECSTPIVEAFRPLLLLLLSVRDVRSYCTPSR